MYDENSENWPLCAAQDIYDFSVAQKEYTTTERSLQSLKEMLQRHDKISETACNVVDNALTRLTQIESAKAFNAHTSQLRLVTTNADAVLIAIDKELTRRASRRQTNENHENTENRQRKSCLVQ
mgnify:CR=1 FL=1